MATSVTNHNHNVHKIECTCGNNVKLGDEASDPLTKSVVSTDRSRDEPNLDTSFVHLPLPPVTNRSTNHESQHLGDRNDGGLYNQGILDSYRYLKTMVQVAEQHLDQVSTDDWAKSDHCLCETCIER
jgi:hypothetical protein